jgi:hypothetical protein
MVGAILWEIRYILRRTRLGFEKARGMTGEEAAAAMTEGKKQYELVKRQVMVYDMFQSTPSIMK